MYLILTQKSQIPFDTEIILRYKIFRKSFVRVYISDFFNKRIVTLIDDEHSPGEFEYEFNGNFLESGVYKLTAETENYIETRRIIMINDRLNSPAYSEVRE